MNRNKTLHAISNLSIFILILWAGFAQAETVDCTPITSAPYTITSQGIYCFTGNLSTSQTSGNAITIDTNNVTIDMNGWKLGGLAAGAGTDARGIVASASGGRHNITIRNGSIRGFRFAIVISGNGAVVEDIRADGNTEYGIWVANGTGALIQRNQVINTGGSTLSDHVHGIYVGTTSSRILNNQVSKLTPSGAGNAYGIQFSAGGGDGSLIHGNLVSETSKPTGGGSSYGIYVSGFNFGGQIFRSDDVAVTNNTIAFMNTGIYYGSLYTTGIYANNLAMRCDTPFTGGTAAGSTNYSN